MSTTERRVRHVLDWVDKRAGTFLVILALIMGGLYAYQVHGAGQDAARDAERSACQVKFNEAFAAQLAARSTLTTLADQAQTDLLSGVSKTLTLKPSVDPQVRAKRAQDFLLLFRRFDAATDAVKAAREATPLPPLPDC